MARVADVSDPRVAKFLSFGGGEVEVRAGVVPKVQTTSVKNGENGLLWARWSAFWAQRRLAGCVVRTQTRYCEWEPAISHANPLVGVWAALPRLGTAGPRAD